MRLAESIYEQNYSQEDKRTCNVKKNIALIFLKSNHYEEALQEFKEVEILEKVLYGDSSLNLAKTYKTVGTL